ncbi:MAG: hypothetical protein ACFBSC_04080 [Microcoleaceae cyanobacterium]
MQIKQQVAINVSANKSQVEMHLEVAILPVFNLMMGPMVWLKMARVVGNAVEELKYFAENGIPHPRKLEMQHKCQTLVA